MSDAIIECVPNISEGRDNSLIDKIIASIPQNEKCSVLGVEPDADYNRTVITIAGEPNSVFEAAYCLIKSSIENIDMSKHKGEHPRLGVVDVCPFVPLRNYSMEECVHLSEKLAKKVSEDFLVPTFLYGFAAKHEDRKLLSTLRKEEYEGLKNRLAGGVTSHKDTTRMPDFGPTNWDEVVSKSGGITIGARNILVAYNVNVDEKDAFVSKKIGSIVRGSGRLIKNSDGEKMRVRGMIEQIQGMGVTLESHGISQVSMNILDVEKCPIHKAFEICKSIAADHSMELKGSELVGLVPLAAILESGKWYSNESNAGERDLVEAAIRGLGLSVLETFDPNTRIIEWALRGGK